MKLSKQAKIFKTPRLPGDKSISHRSLIFSAMANGKSALRNVSPSEDVKSTQKVLMNLSVEIFEEAGQTIIESQGKYFSKPKCDLDCGNAGTLMRLLMGALVAQKFDTTLIGDESLSLRPMDRIADPLQQMGAEILLENKKFAPVKIKGKSEVCGTTFDLKVASAQIKSALLIAGLYSVEADTILKGKIISRDHTERLLRFFGADISVSSNQIILKANQSLKPVSYEIPNDISAASFWITAALLASESDVFLKNVGINPTRMGFVNILKKAGANIEIEELEASPEPTGHIRILNTKLNSTQNMRLKSFLILENEVPSLIDEVPLLALIATQLDGDSKICGIQELRFKETDRIKTTVEAIKNLGGAIEVVENDLVIPGNQRLTGGYVNSYFDHRIAMMAAVASYCTTGDVQIQNAECAQISDPFFMEQIL